MEKSAPAVDPDAYVASLRGWQRDRVKTLRSAVRANAALDEVVKWGHLVYLANGPVLLIRAEADRVLFGFWRGQRLRTIEQRLKPGGKYEMATLVLHEDAAVDVQTVRRLTRDAVALNRELGDPTRVVKQGPASKSSTATARAMPKSIVKVRIKQNPAKAASRKRRG